MTDRRRPKAKETIAKLLRDAWASADLDTRASKREPDPTPEQRKEMGEWFVDHMRRNAGAGTIIVPLVKRNAK